jgi:hypothetical protein
MAVKEVGRGLGQWQSTEARGCRERKAISIAKQDDRSYLMSWADTLFRKEKPEMERGTLGYRGGKQDRNEAKSEARNISGTGSSQRCIASPIETRVRRSTSNSTSSHPLTLPCFR